MIVIWHEGIALYMRIVEKFDGVLEAEGYDALGQRHTGANGRNTTNVSRRALCLDIDASSRRA